MPRTGRARMATLKKENSHMDDNKVKINFDHHSAAYKEHWAIDAEHRATKCPVAWTDAHGGYWILSGHAELTQAVNDHETFSSAHNSPDKPWSKGILIPELPFTLSLSESDPPVHGARRMVEAPYFGPQAVRRLAEINQRHIDKAIESVIDKGQLDFATDFAMRVAAKTTMELVGIDPELWQTFMLSAHQATLLPTDHPDYPIDAIKFVQAKMREVLAERKKEPREDIASALATKTALGEPLSEEVQVGMMSAAIFGGFGTVMSATLSALAWLEDKQEEIRQRVLDDDKFAEQLVEEILRVNPPNHGTARTVGRDVELHGQRLRKGDRILFSWAAANRDPKVFECPAEIRPERANAKEHFSFGGGHHKCLGAPLARIEVRQMIRAVLTHMPDYRIDHDAVTYYPSFANTAGYSSMPAHFTPRKG